MSYSAGVLLAILAAAIAIMVAVQINEYVRRRSILTPAHFALRLVSGLLLLVLIGAIYLGAAVEFASRVGELVYWSALLLGAAAVAALAVLDLRLLERIKHQRRAELYRRLADAEEELRRTMGEDE